MGELFSMEGRYNRARYFWIVVFLQIIGYLLGYLLGMVVGTSGGDTSTAQALSLLISIPIAILVAFQVVKRLHDLDRPGSNYWLLLIPLYNIYLGLVILFKKGTEGPNKYGPDPLEPNFSPGIAQ
jgi:uncharacterized membrane protein YhaH (DUF805 family)